MSIRETAVVMTVCDPDEVAALAKAYLEHRHGLEKYTHYRSKVALPGDHSMPSDILLGMYKVIDQADGVNRGGLKES